MKFPRPSSALIFILFFGVTAQAGTIDEPFDTTDRQDSGNMVWIPSTGKIQPNLKVYDINPIGGPAGQFKDLNIGDGSHGVFDSTTYSQFDEDGDDGNNVIVITTDTYPEGLQFVSFTLDEGVTLQGQGSLPLVILSQTSIVVNGTIDCSGGDGVDSTLTDTDTLAGGVGRCGGANGGDGAPTGSVGSDGLSAGSPGVGVGGPVGGGFGGAGGGGGGSHNYSGSTAIDGDNPNAATVGTGGAVVTSDATFALLEGGSGGGGGSADPGVSSGSSGGAGGGVIWMVAGGNFDIGTDGYILANGGAGGGGNDAGGGGGGGGGSIAIFSGGDYYNNHSGVAAVSALGGQGGVTLGNDNDGGSGADGRTWVADTDSGPDGTGGSSEAPGNFYFAEGEVEHVDGESEAISQVIDTLNTGPTLTGVTLTETHTGTSTVTLEIASGTQENFNPSGLWAEASTLIGQKLSRYIRFRVVASINAKGEEAYVDGVSLAYDENNVDDFELVSNCGTVTKIPPPHSPLGGWTIWTILILSIPMWVYLCRRFGCQIPFKVLSRH